jgi:hypothetical protein
MNHLFHLPYFNRDSHRHSWATLLYVRLLWTTIHGTQLGTYSEALHYTYTGRLRRSTKGRHMYGFADVRFHEYVGLFIELLCNYLAFI